MPPPEPTGPHTLEITAAYVTPAGTFRVSFAWAGEGYDPAARLAIAQVVAIEGPDGPTATVPLKTFHGRGLANAPAMLRRYGLALPQLLAGKLALHLDPSGREALLRDQRDWRIYRKLTRMNSTKVAASEARLGIELTGRQVRNIGEAFAKANGLPWPPRGKGRPKKEQDPTAE